jgi:hypothetical protein
MLPSLQGGGNNDVIVVVVDAPYPDKGEAGMAVAEATGEDGEGGASDVPTISTMDTSIAGKGKGAENAGANPVASRSAEEMVIFLCANPTMDSVQDLKMLARDKILREGGRFGQGGVVGQDGTNRGYGQAMGLTYGGCGGVGVGGLQAGQRSNGSNAPHSISKGVCAAEISERTEKEGELTVMSPLAFVAVPTAPPSLQGQHHNNPHSISKDGSAAKISERTNNPHSISKGGSAAKILERTKNPQSISKGGSTAKILERTNNPHSISEGGSTAKILERTNNPHSISEGRSAAKFLERTEKEGEVTIISPLTLLPSPQLLLH